MSLGEKHVVSKRNLRAVGSQVALPTAFRTLCACKPNKGVPTGQSRRVTPFAKGAKLRHGNFAPEQRR